jgi:hypothetical protein
MPVTVNCPQCNTSLDIPEDVPAGKRLRCPDCGVLFSASVEDYLATGLQTAPSRSPLPARAMLAPLPTQDDAMRGAIGRTRGRRSGSLVMFILVGVLLVLSLCCAAGGISTYVYRPPDNPIQDFPQQLPAQRLPGPPAIPPPPPANPPPA